MKKECKDLYRGILGSSEIRMKLQEIFKNNTGSEKCIQEASYDLRVASDVLVFGGQKYNKGNLFKGNFIKISPGEIALFSTVEQFSMPDYLTGKVGIKFKFTRQGLIPLFGAQVDPLYGNGYPDERLYLIVCNSGSKNVLIKPFEPVFNMEFYVVQGDIEIRTKKRRPYVFSLIEDQFFRTESMKRLGSIDEICETSNQNKKKLQDLERKVNEVSVKTDTLERGTKQIIFFGLFVIIGTLMAAILSNLFYLLR